MSSPTLEQRLAVRNKPSNKKPVMYQKWKELLFLHWKFDPEAIQDSLPVGLTVDTYKGEAFIGLVPFYMRGVRPRICPPIPLISNFLEMNVRTYVYDQHGNPGVWFYSLDANQLLAVLIARKFFHLPYYYSNMQANCKDNLIHYESRRFITDKKYTTKFNYQIGEKIDDIDPDSLEFFLIERYLLFAFNQKSNTLFSGQVYHTPYPLSNVAVTSYGDAPIQLIGFDCANRKPDHMIGSHGVDVDIFSIEPISN